MTNVRFARGVLSGLLLAGISALSVASCGTPESAPVEEATDSGDGDSASATPEALYHTSLTFVGFGAEPALLHMRLENRTEPGRLRMDYRGWIPGPGTWTPVLAVQDSIPVPRAAWRVVPAGPLSLSVEEGGQLSSLKLALEGGGVRLDAMDEVSTWSGSTGQRESLRIADLQAAGRVESGWLLRRRRARLLSEASGERILQAFVLSDTLGNGLLILRDRAFPDAPATVWAWIDGVRLDWSDAVLVDLPGTAGPPGSWSFEVPDAGMFGEISGAAPMLDELPPTDPGFRLYRATASIGFGEQRRTMSGIGFEERGP
ncbi:MAG: hypothetical protein M8835_11270 [marine benthic group bacterium]|nr:hypothetical protein [Gemmatimonadota bacterium]